MAWAGKVLACRTQVEAWRGLLAALVAGGHLELAYRVVDESSRWLGLEPARRLLGFLPGPPLALRGQSFAQGGEAQPWRASWCQGGVLVPTRQGWQRFAASAWHGELVWPVAADAVVWGAGGGVVVASGSEVRFLGEGRDGLLARFDGEITGLMAAGDGCALAVVVARPAPKAADFFWLRGGERRLVVNAVQTLRGDCVPWQAGVVSIHGGMQCTEVRFLSADGGWQTRTLHGERVLALALGECGAVATVDAGGWVLVWDGASGRAVGGGALQVAPAELGCADGTALWCEARQTLWLASAERERAWRLGLADGTRVSYEGLRRLPLASDVTGLAPVLARDGWIWWDLRAGEMVAPWQLPAALVVEAELPGSWPRTWQREVMRWQAQRGEVAPRALGWDGGGRVRFSPPVVVTLAMESYWDELGAPARSH